AAMGAGGLYAIDVTDATHPRLAGTLGTSGTAYGVALDAGGTIAYVADADGGLQVVSVATPGTPKRLGGVVPSGAIYRDVAVAGHYAYLAHQNGSLDVIDVASSSAPVRVASRPLSGFGRKLAIEGTRVAVLSQTVAGDILDVFDVTNPTQPALLR